MLIRGWSGREWGGIGGWLEGMQRACRREKTSGLNASIKLEAADVRSQ